MIKIIYLFLAFSLSLNASSITIAVAANVSFAIKELKEAYTTFYPNTKVKIIIGSSGKLSAQIIHGAPYDIFMSANMIYPHKIYMLNFAKTEPIVYAKGSLSLLSSKKQDFSKGLELLKDKKIKKIAIANPKTAPYGKSSVEALKNAHLYGSIKNKFVYGESISSTLTYSLKATDIGIVATSTLYSSKLSKYKENINWKKIDQKLYKPIEQGIVILKHGRGSKEVKSFFEFILSQKAKKIFEKYGYIIK